MDELIEQAEVIVKLIRSQNWKNGGVLTVDHDDAVAAVVQSMKTAYQQGLLDAFDAATDKIRMPRDGDSVEGDLTGTS